MKCWICETNQENQNVYFSFRSSKKNSTENYTPNSDVEMFSATNSDIFYLHWYYIIGQFAVDVIYTETPEEFDLNGAKLPNNFGGFVNLSKLNYEQNYFSFNNK